MAGNWPPCFNSSLSRNFFNYPQINYPLKILLVKTYGNTFFIEGELKLFYWKCLIVRWKEDALSYTCVSFFGAEMTENNYYRTSNTPKNQKNGLEWHVWASNKWCFGALVTIQRHACVAESTFFPTRYQTNVSNAFNERVKVLLRWKTCSHMFLLTIFWVSN